MSLLRRPQSTALRRVLFQVHLWTGIAAGFYLFIIGLTGSVVVFRQELQRRAYPEFFTPARPSGQNAAPAVVVASLRAAYPDYRVSGIDWPTYRRDTFLAYVSRGSEFRTVFASPATGEVVGELPYDWIRWLQDLHFDLLAGRTGRTVNGIGAICLLVMCLTGLVVWWPGLPRWHTGLRVDFRRGWKRVTWELHGAAGFWTVAVLLVWALTGIYFAFPQPFRAAIDALSPLTVARVPQSQLPRGVLADALTPDDFVARARRYVPDARIARIVLPGSERAPFTVVLARGTHGDADTSDEVTLDFDQHGGALLRARDNRYRSAGDTVMAWITPLHFGSFGGMPMKIAWALAGLALPLLFASGLVMWWNRVAAPRRAAAAPEEARPAKLN